MTPEERNKIINAIIVMWEKITAELTLKEKFKQDLQEAKDNQLVAIYFRHKNEMEKRNIKIENSMWLSQELYSKIKRVLREQKMQNQSNLSKNTIIPELLQITKSAIAEGTSEEDDGLLFNPEKLAELSIEKQDEILAIVWYYQLLNESQDRTNIKEIVTTVATKINEFFPFRADFYHHAHNSLTENWSVKTKEERYQDLNLLVGRFLNTSKENRRRKVVDSN